VLPISSPPIRRGWIAVDDQTIAGCGPVESRPHAPAGPLRDLGRVALMPGLVNAHTHFEFSYLRGASPRTSNFMDWVRTVIRARREQTDPHAPVIVHALERGLQEAVACGTAVAGDISNTLASVEPLLRSPLAGVVFYELIRFNTDDPAAIVGEARRAIDALEGNHRVRTSLAAHAPYSVAPGLFREIRRFADSRPTLPYSVHLAESPEEVRFIERGEGPWRVLLEDIGAWAPSWVAPGVSPVRYLDEIGFLGPRVIAVHGVQMSQDDLARLTACDATVVACPRSNAYTGVGRPPVRDFYASGVRVAIGTDSLASAPDLNLFAELAAMRALAPEVSASRLLESATLAGARALGFDDEFGTLEVGKQARVLAVDLPLGVLYDVPPNGADVEEYLVSGIRPDQIRWLDTC
jgi:cytosine/adenosine deaminase-related metal-dependent hydrolase